jgi:hypothetical protein
MGIPEPGWASERLAISLGIFIPDNLRAFLTLLNNVRIERFLTNINFVRDVDITRKMSGKPGKCQGKPGKCQDYLAETRVLERLLC